MKHINGLLSELSTCCIRHWSCL